MIINSIIIFQDSMFLGLANDPFRLGARQVPMLLSPVQDSIMFIIIKSIHFKNSIICIINIIICLINIIIFIIIESINIKNIVICGINIIIIIILLGAPDTEPIGLGLCVRTQCS